MDTFSIPGRCEYCGLDRNPCPCGMVDHWDTLRCPVCGDYRAPERPDDTSLAMFTQDLIDEYRTLDAKLTRADANVRRHFKRRSRRYAAAPKATNAEKLDAETDWLAGSRLIAKAQADVDYLRAMMRAIEPYLIGTGEITRCAACGVVGVLEDDGLCPDCTRFEASKS
jgi:hypothetical protein